MALSGFCLNHAPIISNISSKWLGILYVRNPAAVHDEIIELECKVKQHIFSEFWFNFVHIKN